MQFDIESSQGRNQELSLGVKYLVAGKQIENWFETIVYTFIEYGVLRGFRFRGLNPLNYLYLCSYQLSKRDPRQ